MNTLARIERSQKRIFRSIQNDLQILEKNKSKDLKKYEQKYKKIFRKKFSISDRSELIHAALQSDIIFIGDFHPFNQSQKTFLRIIREIKQKNPDIVIALECIQARFQKEIDHYLHKKISLEELREEILFSEFWPFSWKNYSEILQYAREEKISVLGLNISKEDKSPMPLSKRDSVAAELLAKARLQEPEKKIFVLYGELHLAHEHIPYELEKRTVARSLLIYQNEPALYWKSAKRLGKQKAEVLKFSKNQFCIMNAVPWVKLQAYLDWLEGNSDSDDYDNNEIDLCNALQKQSLHLCASIGIEAPQFLDFDVQGWESISYLKGLIKQKHFTRIEAQALRNAILMHRVLALPAKNLLYLPNTSTNALAEAASLLLYFSFHKPENLSPQENRSALILQSCMGYLGSKILNPKRKCNEEKDIKLQARQTKQARYWSFVLAAKEIDWIFGRRKRRYQFKAKPYRHSIEAARYVGYLLGDRLYNAMHKNQKLLPYIIELFRSRAGNPSTATESLLELAKQLPKRGPEIQSKHAKL